LDEFFNTYKHYPLFSILSAADNVLNYLLAIWYFISDSFSVTSLLLTWLFYIAFSLTFTTAELLLLQLRVVWQPRLHSVAETSQHFLTVLLYHLHYNIFSFSGWTSWHKERIACD